MKPLERYLQKATAGVWGRKKLEIREELHAHILEQAHKFEVFGLDKESAVTRVLEQLGDAKSFSQAMRGVHTMPKVFTALGLVTISTIALVAMLSVSQAQIIFTERTPIEQCRQSSEDTITLKFPSGQEIPNFSCSGGSWLSIESLKAVLEPQGVKFETTGNSFTTVNGQENQQVVRLDFPNGGFVRFYTAQEFRWKVNSNSSEAVPFIPGYVYGSFILEAFRNGGGGATIAGWDLPAIRYAGIRFTLGTKDQPIRSAYFYRDALYQRLAVLFTGWATQPFFWSDSDTKNEGFPVIFRDYQHVIQTKLPVGRIVAVFSSEDTQTITYKTKTTTQAPAYRSYLAPIRADGTLEYPSAAKTISFANDLRDLTTTKKDSVGNVVVMQFTGDLSYGKPSFVPVPINSLSK